MILLFLTAAKLSGPRAVGVVVFQENSLVVNIISSIVLGIPQFPLIIFFGVGSVSHTRFLFTVGSVAPK